ncbi:MAG: hypothetical protein ACE5K8_09680, partial [Candidatus Zixiibacteriota bacterium]
ISIFSQLPIKIPSLFEQKEIVSKIEQLFSDLDNAIDNLKKVKDQLKVALGEKLTYRQEELQHKWAAIECRINAEDVRKDFRPSPGEITGLHIPGGPGVRVDRAIYTGYLIPPYYDSMIAKLIVKARTRQEAIMRMQRCLDEFIVEGVPTTIPFHQEIFDHPDFIAGNYNISFLETSFRTALEVVEEEKVSVTVESPGEGSAEKAAGVRDEKAIANSSDST